MTNPDTPKPVVTAERARVTQADREAAAQIYACFRDHDYAGWVRQGTNAGGDYDFVIQLFAKVRITAEQSGRRAMREALQPFADCCDQIADDESDEEWAKFRLLIGDYRRARAAIQALTEGTEL